MLGKSIRLGILSIATLGVLSAPALAGRFDGGGTGGRNPDRDDDRGRRYERHDRDARSGDRHDDRGDGRGVGYVGIQIGGGTICPPPPRVIEERVWVPPVYRTVYDRVWIEPVTRTEYERVWVTDRYEWRDAVRCVNGRDIVVRDYVLVEPGHYVDQPRTVVVTPGRFEDRPRQELVCVGRWEVRTVAVAGAPRYEGSSARIDFRFPL